MKKMIKRNVCTLIKIKTSGGKIYGFKPQVMKLRAEGQPDEPTLVGYKITSRTTHGIAALSTPM